MRNIKSNESILSNLFRLLSDIIKEHLMFMLFVLSHHKTTHDAYVQPEVHIVGHLDCELVDYITT